MSYLNAFFVVGITSMAMALIDGDHSGYLIAMNQTMAAAIALALHWWTNI